MSTHTPGPWQHARILTWSENDRGWLIAAPGGRIADVWPMCDEDGNASPEAEANARLIAAAPGLLAALQGMLDQFRFTSINPGDDDAVAAAIAAIDKAKGRA